MSGPGHMSTEELMDHLHRRSVGEPISVSVEQWVETRPDEVACLLNFHALMVEELAANAGKGDRPGWRTMNGRDAVSEVFWHAAKLAVSVREYMSSRRLDEERAGALTAQERQQAAERVKEYAADVSNCAMMVVDVLDLLFPEAPE